jgi:carboxypeptidase Taq
VTALAELKELLGEVSDLQRAAGVLAWDQQTYMPEGGVESRSSQLSTLRRLAHEAFSSDRLGRRLEAAESEVTGWDPEEDDASIVRVTRRDHDLARRIPAELIARAAKAGAVGHSVWLRARALDDWNLFAPHLRVNVELNRRIAEAIGYAAHPYDALLERSEPEMTVTVLKRVFDELKSAAVPLLRRIAERDDAVDAAPLHGLFDADRQLAYAAEVARRIGYDLKRGRQDLAAHPFCVAFGPGDVRITTRVDGTYLPMCLFATIHEAGHGLYNHGIGVTLDRTPAWGGASPGVHESQSRLWENLVGRSLPFWRHFFPSLQRTFPKALGGVEVEAFHRAVNRVAPTLIRVEADEVTYNLHILMRFEMELALLEGSLSVDDVPEAWRAKVREYLGVEPGSDAEGPLQDVHWSGVSFGGFPSYTLGNLIGVQLLNRAREALPELDRQVEGGDFSGLLEWLRENVYRHGRKFTPGQLLRRVTDGELDARPWISYATDKFSAIYGL